MLKFIAKQMITPYTRLWHSSKQLAKTTSDGISHVRETAKNARKRPEINDPDIILARNIQNGRERFEFLYRQKNWTQRELEARSKNLTHMQLAYSLGAILGIVLSLWQASMIHEWGVFAVVGAVCGWLAMAVFAGNVIRFALMKTQLDERELLDYKTFANRDDFWRRIMMPWLRFKTMKAR